jgi:hypothetical protein
MSNPTTDPRIEEAYKLIDSEATVTGLSPRELMVIVLALAERAGANVPEDEDSHSGWNAKEVTKEADVILDRFLARLTVGR